MSASICDAHNHLQDKRLAPHLPELLRTLPQLGIRRCVVNGTSEEDWPAVATLARSHPELIHPSFGLHPWHIHLRSADWQPRLLDFLAEFPAAGIGECGLDRWMPDPDLDAQREVFLWQLELAARENRPLSIHCLQAWGPLLEALREHPRPERGFLLHSYGGSAELVAELVPLGARFSCSGYFLHPRKHKVLEAYRRVPDDRLLLESDAPDMLPPDDYATVPLTCADGEPLNHPGNLPAIAKGLAAALHTDPVALIDRTNGNFNRFFG